MLLALLALHAITGTATLTVAGRIGRRGFILGGIAPLATIVTAAAVAGRVLDGDAVEDHVGWVPQIGLDLALRLDPFSLLMILLVSGVGTLVYIYAWHYFGSAEKSGRAAGLLTLFAGAMLGVVLADNLLLLYVCWELTSITSYLLIGIDDEDPEARSAALHALLVTGFGGLAMLGGFVVLGQQAGTFTISEILASPPGGTTTSVALVFILVGAFTKSAQYPFHSWLPGAMVAPTPISAYLHSAAMVKVGVYLVARMSPAFADVGIWRPLVVGVGLVTMIAGGLRALRPDDLKRLLAFGTISQLGFMMVLLGIGHPEATAAGCALLLSHGLFKAALFMVVGIVDHETHTRDISALPRLGRGWSSTRLVAVVSAASMAAVPPLAGFIAKEEAYAAFVEGSSGERLVLAGIVFGSILTVAYSLRFVAALIRPDLVAPSSTPRARAEAGPGIGFLAPGVVLAIGTAVLGVAPVVWDDIVNQASLALDPDSGVHLALWHGINAPLLLSMFTLAAGGGVFALRGPVAKMQARLAPSTDGGDIFDGVVRGVLRTAARITSVFQSGSLPVYAAIIFATAAIAPGIALLSGPWWSGWPDLVGRPGHLPIVALLVIGAVAASVANRRFVAAILLGIVGYGMALLFVVQGAPDLALTQFAVETLSVVVFLLVLRKLPDRFEQRRSPAIGRAVRLGVSAMVGTFIVAMALASSGARTQAPVSDAMSARALSEGDGKNIVNVILVDIRGLDTLGEITVLVTAAIGITALARIGRAPRRRPSLPAREEVDA